MTLTHRHSVGGGVAFFSAMEAFRKEAQAAISRMIAEMPPLSSFSVKSDDKTVEIRLETKSETEPILGLKKKKPSTSRIRRNQRRLLMFQEKDKAAKSTEPVNSRSTDDSAGEPLLTRASTPAIIKRDGPALPNTQIKEIDDNKDNLLT